MATSNKFEVLTDRSKLKTGDQVTVVNLADGKVYQNQKVTYVYGSAVSEFEVTSTGGTNTYFGSHQVPSLVIVVSAKPKNWPPKPNDVWMIGGYIWHTLGSSTTPHFRRASSASTSSNIDTVLRDYGMGTAELLYRRS